MMKRYIIGLDAGTTSVRTVIYDVVNSEIVLLKRAPITSSYPHKGWVEQDAEEIFFNLKKTLESAIEEMNVPLGDYIGAGLTNQRETSVAFDSKTGKPYYKAIVWQCRRTNDYIENLPQEIKTIIKQKTGLIPDAYFSASKFKWLKDNVKKVNEAELKSRLYFGTLDAYLAFMFTGNFVTDVTNASRTMLFNISELNWDNELLKFFGIKKETLPKVISNAEEVGCLLNTKIPLLSMIGDQQSSLVGNGAFDAGMAKMTYGTGGFVLLNTGNNIIRSNKILSTVAYSVGGKTYYALEGSIFSACSALDWAKKELSLTEDYDLLDQKMLKLKSNNGIYFVPAFTGLGCPYWKPNAQGIITGLTFDTDKYMIMRACYESIAYNTKAIFDEMTKTHKIKIQGIRADGGGSKSRFLTSFQAGLLGVPVLTGKTSEATVLGCIYLAGVAAKVFDFDKLNALTKPVNVFAPNLSSEEINKLYAGWEKAIKNV